jgi:hypothetical protein
MFEEYLQDAYEFFDIAQKASQEANERKARRYYRASVFYTAGAIEAFINYIADSFAMGEALSPHEIAFINDKSIYFSTRKFAIEEKTEFHRLEDKLKFLIKRFQPGFDFGASSEWSKLIEFKEFRDSLVHPRQYEDKTSTVEYQMKLRRGISGVIQVMNCLSRAIFKKDLRKQILDLIPE